MGQYSLGGGQHHAHLREGGGGRVLGFMGQHGLGGMQHHAHLWDGGFGVECGFRVSMVSGAGSITRTYRGRVQGAGWAEGQHGLGGRQHDTHLREGGGKV